ncbi:hypothetical protein [Streptococcus equi]|nr:hypothetical protein [Streptococcus equi]MDI6075532.1 hypothetical protein [Streptococcus equi subsp. zooepidemicus]WGS36271.1 hypothetical protein P1X07_10395 [Streptococcus equi]
MSLCYQIFKDDNKK